MRGWIEWFAKGLWRRRKVIYIFIGISVVLALAIAWLNRSYILRADRTIDDASFVSAANKVCGKRIIALRAVRREDNTDDNLELRTAKQIERVAPKLSAIVDHLRGLEVNAASKAEVNAWIGHYDDYIAAGLRYAAAIRRGNPDEYNKVDDEGVAPLRAISQFARGNRIDACIP